MLRLIIKNGNGIVKAKQKMFSDDEPEPDTVDLTAYRVFEINHPVLEEYIKSQRDGNKPINLVAVEVFDAPIAPPPPPVVLVPTQTTPAAQASLKDMLEHRQKLRNTASWRLWGRKAEEAKLLTKPLNLPG